MLLSSVTLFIQSVILNTIAFRNVIVCVQAINWELMYTNYARRWLEKVFDRFFVPVKKLWTETRPPILKNCVFEERASYNQRISFDANEFQSQAQSQIKNEDIRHPQIKDFESFKQKRPIKNRKNTKSWVYWFFYVRIY